MELLFDKSEVARDIFTSRIDDAVEDWPHPDADDESVQNAIRREAKLACAAASILWQEMEEAGFGYEIGIFAEGMGGMAGFPMPNQLPPVWDPNDPELGSLGGLDPFNEGLGEDDERV